MGQFIGSFVAQVVVLQSLCTWSVKKKENPIDIVLVPRKRLKKQPVSCIYYNGLLRARYWQVSKALGRGLSHWEYLLGKPAGKKIV